MRTKKHKSHGAGAVAFIIGESRTNCATVATNRALPAHCRLSLPSLIAVYFADQVNACFTPPFAVTVTLRVSSLPWYDACTV